MEFNFKKRFGQNFLINNKICNDIASLIDSKPDDLIIEIGPGIGYLTSKLQNKNSQLLCYEIDKDTKPYLDKIINDHTKIIFADFLERNILEDLKDYKYNNLYIVGNLPYYITTPIIEKIINEKISVNRMVFMVQDEVADRFSALPKCKSYSSITVYLNYYFNVKKVFKVLRNNFNPVPNVDSAIIEFTKNDNQSLVNNEQVFLKLIKDAFQFKRKTIKHNLNGYNIDKIEEVLKTYGLSLQSRAEEIPLKVFTEIANTIS